MANMIGDIVESLIILTSSSLKILGNVACELLGIEQCDYDFDKFFKNSNIINNEKEYPTFKGWYKNEENCVYTFSIPPGKSITDFNNVIPAISVYLGVDISSIEFNINTNKKDINLIINFNDI